MVVATAADTAFSLGLAVFARRVGAGTTLCQPLQPADTRASRGVVSPCRQHPARQQDTPSARTHRPAMAGRLRRPQWRRCPSSIGATGENTESAKASSQVPRVLAREYSVARFSKKFVCSIAFSI